MAKPTTRDVDKLAKWGEIDTQALSTILMNIVPNVQAGLDCSSVKAAWDGLLSRYAQADPIAQNLVQTRLRTKHFIEGGSKTLPAHIVELQRLREACGGLGVDVTDAQFSGVITLSMPSPSWDPVIGTLGGVLDPKIVISHLNTEWSRRQGPMTSNKDPNVIFRTSSKLKCKNCKRTGHMKAKCWEKGGGQEGQYPNSKRDSWNPNTVKSVSEMPIVWTYGSSSKLDVWFVDSAATIHVSSNREDVSLYQTYQEPHSIKAFGNNMVKGVGEGDIESDLEYGGNSTRICLTCVMHVPGADGKILSLKVLAQKGFESHILVNCICIAKDGKTYAEAYLGGELYELKMNIPASKESILAAVNRDSPTMDLSTWHWRLGHLSDSMLKKLVSSKIVKGM